MQLASLYLSYIPKKRLMSWLFFVLLTFLLLLQVMASISYPGCANCKFRMLPLYHKGFTFSTLLIIFELRLAVHFTILILTRLDFNKNKTPFQKIIETHPDMLSFAWLHSLQIISGLLKSHCLYLVLNNQETSHFY